MTIVGYIFLVFFIRESATGNSSGTSTNTEQTTNSGMHSHPDYPPKRALPLWRKGDSFFTYNVPDSEKIYACPMNMNEILDIQLEHRDADCITPVNTDQCEDPVVPLLQDTQKPCAGNKGIIFSYRYDLCFKKHFKLDEQSESGQESDLPVYVWNPLLIYSVCIDNESRDTIFTSHKISSKYFSLLPNDYLHIVKENSTNVLSEDKAIQVTEAYKQFLTETEDSDYDNLTPEFIVPYQDLDQDFARNFSLHFLNIDFLHKRLIPYWHALNNKIRQLLTKNELLDYITIITVLRDYRFSVRTELIPFSSWVKILQHVNGQSIAIVFQNTEKNHIFPTEESLCTNICEENNWYGVHVDNLEENVHISCCPVNEAFLKKIMSPNLVPVTGILTLKKESSAESADDVPSLERID